MKKFFALFSIIILVGALACAFSGCENNIHITIKYEDGESDKYEATSSFEMDMFSGMYIDWLYGNVYITCTEGKSKATVYEKVVRGSYTENTVMRVNHEDSTYGVSIEYGAEGFTYTGDVVKNLYLEIPFLYYNTVKINIVSGHLETTSLKCIDMSLDIQNGNVKMDLSEINHVNINCPNGSTELDINAFLQDCVVTGGKKNISLVSDLCPSKLDLTTTTGDISVVLPWDSEFRAIFYTEKGKFSTNFDCINSKNYYLCGSDENKINLKTTSGDASVKNFLS